MIQIAINLFDAQRLKRNPVKYDDLIQQKV
jgi:hypothetical protein